MKPLNTLASVVDRIVWAIGCYTIVSYSYDHWPLTSQIVIAMLLGGFGLWYLWRFVIQPFRTGFRGEQS